MSSGDGEPPEEAETGMPDASDDDVPLLDATMLPEVVSELAKTSEQQATRLAELNTSVATLDEAVADHAAGLRVLEETFMALERSLIDKVDMARPSRWAWEFLTKDEAARLWKETRWFVDYLIRRYPLGSEVSIPPCWYRHTVAVDELSDVYAAWREAYCSGDRPSTAMTSWRDRWLWPALYRLATHADWRECKEHREHFEPTARQETTDAEFGAFMTADLARRPAERSTSLPWPTTNPTN
jgi:uncharacterized coiled-coil protein SlyX